MSRSASGFTYVGHATVLIELAGRRLLTDSLLGAGILHVRRQLPGPELNELRSLDAILISHARRDHLDHRSLRRLAADVPGHRSTRVRIGGAAGRRIRGDRA